MLSGRLFLWVGTAFHFVWVDGMKVLDASIYHGLSSLAKSSENGL